MTSLNIPRAITAVVQQIANRGGATESIVAGVETPTSGYAVSIPGREVVNHLLLDGDQRAQAIYDSVRLYVDRNQSWLAQPGYFLGAWLDGDRLVLDVTQVTPELGQAVWAGLERDQDAIYNLGTGTELWLKRKRVTTLADEQQVVWGMLDLIDEAEQDKILTERAPFEVVSETKTYDDRGELVQHEVDFEVVGNVRVHLARTDAQKRFDALSGDIKRALARQVFEILEYDEDDQPGGTWGGDELAAIGELYTNHGITFTEPS